MDRPLVVIAACSMMGRSPGAIADWLEEADDAEAAMAAVGIAAKLEVERAGYGGDRIAEIEREVSEANTIRDRRRERFDRFNTLLAQAGLAAVETAEQFCARLAASPQARTAWAIRGAKDTDLLHMPDGPRHVSPTFRPSLT